MEVNLNTYRRFILKSACSSLTLGVAIAGGLLKPTSVLASGTENDFEEGNLNRLMGSLSGGHAVISNMISIKAPDIADSGAAVPIEISSGHPNTESIAIMIDKNPFPLAAKFDFYNGTEGFVATKLRLAGSSDVRVLVRANGQVYSASKTIKVSIGGCAVSVSSFTAFTWA
jgi:sulfur-oxidizing protein SoxY